MSLVFCGTLLFQVLVLGLLLLMSHISYQYVFVKICILSQLAIFSSEF